MVGATFHGATYSMAICKMYTSRNAQMRFVLLVAYCASFGGSAQCQPAGFFFAGLSAVLHHIDVALP